MQLANRYGKFKRVGNHRKQPIIIDLVWTDDRQRWKGKFQEKDYGKLSFRTVNGENILQHVPTRHPETPTAAQQENRKRLNNITRFYAILKAFIPTVWERPKKNPPKLDCDFIATNLQLLEDDEHNIILTPLQNRMKACALTTFQVSNGTLAPITVDQGVSSIRVPRHFAIDEQTTIAEFSAALIASDGRAWREGDSLIYLSVRQREYLQDNELIPRLTYISGRVTLDIQNEQPLYSVFPSEGAAVRNNRLAHLPPTNFPTPDVPTQYGYCWIKTRIIKGNLHASAQHLIIQNS